MAMSEAVQNIAGANPRTVRLNSFRFDDFELDCARSELRRNGSAVAISSLSLMLLEYLLQHRDRVVAQDELLAEVWSGVSVTVGSLRQAVFELRNVLDDNAVEQRVIRTVRGRGYQFAAPLSESRPALGLRSVRRAPSWFFGRAQELSRLERALEQAASMSGRACLLSGPPGIGKSRLAAELVTRARAHGITVLEGWATPDGRSPALWPWSQMLSARLRQLDATRAAEFCAQHPAILQLLRARTVGASLARVTESSAEQLRLELLRDVGDAFVSLANIEPLVLLFEDAQWADETSLALLEHMACLLSQTRALLLVTCRELPARDNRALSRALSALKRGSLNEQLSLERLTLVDVERMLEAHVSTVTPSVCADVYTISRGNPLFALELARLLARSSPEVDLHDGATLELQSVIQTRLDYLPDAATETLRAASVLGNEFALGELAGVLQQDAGEALAQLDACIDHGAIEEEDSPLRFRFSHPLVREAAYNSLTKSARVRLHQRAGAWIERLGEDSAVTRLAELAHHFYIAAPSEPRKALEYAVRCGDRAYHATAYRDASLHYERALAAAELDPTADARCKLELELLRGEAMRAAGIDHEQVNRHFRSLAERAEALGDGPLFAKAVLGYTGQRSERFTPTNFDASLNAQEVALLDRALSALGPEPSELRVLLYCSLSFALFFSADRARREQVAQKAVAEARLLDNAPVLARALLLFVRCSPACIRPEPKLVACEELIQLTHAHGLHELELEGRVLRAFAQLELGEVEAASEDEEQALLLARALGTPRAQVRSELFELMRALWTGQLVRADELARRALSCSPTELTEQAHFTIRSTAILCLRNGPNLAVLALHEQLHVKYPDAVSLRCVIASIRATLGHEQAARAHFDWLAKDDFRRIPEDPNWLSAMCMLADAAMHLSDPQYAELVYARLLPYGDLFDFYAGDSCPSGPIAHWLAQLAITIGNFEDARRWNDAARALCERLGATMFAQYCLLADAHLMLVSRPEQRDEPLALLQTIIAFSEATGAGWVGRCAAHLSKQAYRPLSERLSMVQSDTQVS